MSELVAPDTILNMLDAIRTQTDIITALSSGALGVILLTWGRVLGILDDADMSSFRFPALLIFPAFALLLSVIIGYLTGALSTGYLTEVARGIDTTSGSQITDAARFYFDSYDSSFNWMTLTQLLTSISGVSLIAIWFSANVLFHKRGYK